MALTIIAIGKKHEDWVQVGIERYQKRLRAPMDVKWVLLPHSRFEGDRARQEESERIRARIPSDAYVLLLDERGVEFDSPKLARHLERVFAQGRGAVCKRRRRRGQRGRPGALRGAFRSRQRSGDGPLWGRSVHGARLAD